MELNKEVLKGHIDTLILSILDEKDSYGYEIAKIVRDKTTFNLKDGTMYVSLKRLESKGSIKSYWGDEQGAGSRRKYYNITDEGKTDLGIKIKEWDFVQNIMNQFLEGRR
ncbi:PadR family transcriptional regulator [Romboutsia sedimentorum]|uniref:PadR family transcriptional regulator n=1 Tax=Romboutsia sedimentorum TaxID=1368474 RepID=A0ABT7E5V2_9FIRM|nr:PadR family transcriptional regulator [Romboutsia sedimentorum]MDK2562305.1 PadR family transcriptional regulator [Romboutsia sedimentorum]